MYRMGKDPDKKKKSYRKKQNRNLGQNGTALEAIEKVRCIFVFKLFNPEIISNSCWEVQ